jgi:ligand-binding sensor domain-containing protein/two-component sensor histidine kinase
LAVNPNLSLDQYLHTSWTQEEGSALPPIQAIAQAADGYLWLGTSNGLIRFDGMRFTEWTAPAGMALPNSNISCLVPASGGGLWAGTRGGLCRIDRGRVIRYRSLDKLPCGVMASLAEDRSGRLWILNTCPTSNLLAALSADDSLQIFGVRDGLPGGRLRALYEDRQGNLWIGTSDAICQWSPGKPANCSQTPALSAISIAETGDGAMAIADDVRSQIFRFWQGKLQPETPRIPDAAFMRGAMLGDRDGNIWIGTLGQGLLRLRNGRVDRLTRTQGLSNNLVAGIVEDREGDIWIATAGGVDRIRDPKVQMYSTRNGLSSDLIDTVYGADDGGIWIGTAGGGIDRLDGERVAHYSAGAGQPGSVVASMFEDQPGKLWVGTAAGLILLSGNRRSEILTERGRQLDTAMNIAGNHSGAVWVADRKQGLFTVHGGVAHPMSVPGADTGDISSLLAARNGDLRGGSLKHFDTRDGLGSGPVRALYQDAHGSIWAGTGNSLSRLRDSRWISWGVAQGLPDGSVEGIVDDEAGGLWLLTPAGVLRLSIAGLDGPASSLQTVLYGRTEGLRLGSGVTNPRITRSRDGRLWVCTEDGVAAIDPARVRSNPVPPSVAIEQVIADGKFYDAAAPEEAVFRGHDLQITYTGISLMVPERVRFRYRMEGPRSSTWTDAGSRRNVAYMNLSPGHYKFHVIASNNDGLWNPVGAAVALRVDPYFYQTTWFAALCVTSILLVIWSAHRFRVRRAVARVQLIAAERVRFSRELHDSLLQGFSGVVFLLEAAVRQFEAQPGASKQRLERALDQADQSLREARQMISSMRIPVLDDHTLPEALQLIAAQMTSEVPIEFQFEIKGQVHHGPYDVEANLFLIAREAVTNALTHAAARRVRLELFYSPNRLHMTVQDDGTGFDTEMAMAKSGHWGFRGMRERARQIGAEFKVNSAPGSGTTLEVGVVWKK